MKNPTFPHKRPPFVEKVENHNTKLFGPSTQAYRGQIKDLGYGKDAFLYSKKVSYLNLL
jgi:hypothetical protein